MNLVDLLFLLTPVYDFPVYLTSKDNIFFPLADQEKNQLFLSTYGLDINYRISKFNRTYNKQIEYFLRRNGNDNYISFLSQFPRKSEAFIAHAGNCSVKYRHLKVT